MRFNIPLSVGPGSLSVHKNTLGDTCERTMCVVQATYYTLTVTTMSLPRYADGATRGVARYHSASIAGMSFARMDEVEASVGDGNDRRSTCPDSTRG